MTLEDAYFISQIIAAGAIIASLIFVLLQMRQNDLTQRAAMHQARADRIIGIFSQQSASAPLITKAAVSPETLNGVEIAQLRAAIMILVLNLEDQLWQFKQGRLDQASVDRSRFAASRMMSVPAMRAAWLIQKHLILPAQVEVFEREVRWTPLSGPLFPA